MVVVVLSFLWLGLALMATTVYLHRSLAHRAVTFPGPVNFGFRILVWLFASVRPREWVGVHRVHHRHTDEPGDPHSPKVSGFWPVMLGNAIMYRRAAKEPGLVERNAPDLQPDLFDRFLFDRTVPGKIVLIVATGFAIGFVPATIAALLGSLLYVMGGATVNAIGHVVGSRPHPNTATNLRWLTFFTVGESLHNNHHQFPLRARFSERRWEIDPGWIVIRTLHLFGLARLRTGPTVS